MPQFLFRFGNPLFLTWLGGAAFFLFSLESVFNGGFYFSVRILWSPLAVLIFGYTWWHRDFFTQRMRSSWKPWIVALILYPLALLLNWPYLMGFNALTDTGKTITYQGAVQSKWESHGRHISYHVNVLDEASRQIVTLNCSRTRYNHLSQGDFISETFHVGGLGFPYRWKYSKSDPASSLR